MSYLTRKQLKRMGFNRLGDHVMISDKASFYSPETINIGHHVRIDDFCILTGFITFGNNIHISAGAYLYGGGGIVMENFTGVSPGGILLSASDDFSGEHGISPWGMNKNVQYKAILMEKFSYVCARSIVMPGVTLCQGAVLGAMSLAKLSLTPWSIYAGVPARFIKERSRDMAKIGIYE